MSAWEREVVVEEEEEEREEIGVPNNCFVQFREWVLLLFFLVAFFVWTSLRYDPTLSFPKQAKQATFGTKYSQACMHA